LGEEEILERKSDRSGVRPAARASLATLLALVISAFAAACGGEPQGGQGEAEPGGSTQAMSVPEETSAMEETTAEQALTPAEATVGPEENTSMLPAGGGEPDPDQPLPENPPEGVVTYPATTNRTVEGEIDYAQSPPTNGDHAPLWQNCGFYSEPINDVNAVHSLDHGVVWITYSLALSREETDSLRPYGGEEYVIVSPYPGQDAPVIATAWRNQIELDGPDDPRLRQFVDGFRVSEIAPLSGNRCVRGVGEPEPVG
jgi:hypothetical protein